MDSQQPSQPASSRVVRVFPIRDVRATRTQQQETKGQTPEERSLVSQSRIQPPLIIRQEIVEPSVSTISLSEDRSSPGNRYITNRFTFLPGENDSPSATTTPSTRSPATGEKIYRCEDEPIHIPGAIQSFGALVGVQAEHDGSYLVRIVSENSADVINLKPEELFQLPCFTDLLTPSGRNEFMIRAKALRNLETENLPCNPDVFPLSVVGPLGTLLRLFCAMHKDPASNIIICECELDQDVIPLRSQPDMNLPPEPIEVVHNEASEEERLQSTTSKSSPLHSLQIVRASSRQLAIMDSFQILMEVQAQLSAARTLTGLCDNIVGLVRDLTGFHRVMVYQLNETAAGSVISELVDPRASKDLYRGLHFPASDIPKQARDLYMLNTVRILYDRDQETARLICRTFDDTKIPLNLQHSYLRAISPIHLKYLANMGVKASMSISLIADNKLWGLISCHNYGGGAGIHVSLPTREICRGLGNIASSEIQKLIFSSRIAARRPLSNVPPKVSPFTYITSSTADLLNMFGADFGFLVIRGEARTIGTLFAYSEAIVLLQYVRQRARNTIFHSHSVEKDFRDINHPPGFVTISGILVIPLSLYGADFLVFFRKGRLKEIKWAGNPYEKEFAPGTQYLEPRSSFKRWSEAVVGTSREWTEDEVESATVLTALYGRFIEVWRQKEAIVQRNRMTRLLIRNAGHDVRTPLNSIINYLEVALEEELDDRARVHLQQSLQASKSLVVVINDLLHLTEAEESDFQVHEDNVNLRLLISEVVAAFSEESVRRKARISIGDHPAIPQLVRCDPSGLRQVCSNLLSNSLRHSSHKDVNLGLQLIETTEASVTIKISFTDYGTGLTEDQLDHIFRDFEQILDDDTSNTEEQNAKNTREDSLHIGLGLATVAKFTRLHSGQIAMSSEGPGKGTQVSVTIPFRKALSATFNARLSSSDSALSTPPFDVSLLAESKTPGSASSGLSTQPSFVGPFTIIPTSSEQQIQGRYPFPTLTQDGCSVFNVLVAEDNPLNSRLLETRLRKRGHAVRVVVDGQACVEAFRNSPEEFDIILMDIQMPVLDGIDATRLIRELESKSQSQSESESPHPSTSTDPRLKFSPRVAAYGRIPIIAVSASLSEQRIDEYTAVGFDGWILKPIDFQRLEAIVKAIVDEEIRESLYYETGKWEKGGWFRVVGGEGRDGGEGDEEGAE